MIARKLGVYTVIVLAASILLAPAPRAHASVVDDLLNGVDKHTGRILTGVVTPVRQLASGIVNPLTHKVVNPVVDGVGKTLPVAKPVTSGVTHTTSSLLTTSPRQASPPSQQPATQEPHTPPAEPTTSGTATKLGSDSDDKVGGEPLPQRSSVDADAPDFFGVFPAISQLVQNLFSHRKLDTTSLVVVLGILGAMLAVIVGGVYLMIRRGKHGLHTTRHDFQHETVMYRRLSTVSMVVFGSVLIGAGAIYVALLRM